MLLTGGDVSSVSAAIVTAISNVGFPIVMCLTLLFYMRENDKKHDEEVSNLRIALENNTLVMQQLLDKLNS